MARKLARPRGGWPVLPLAKSLGVGLEHDAGPRLAAWLDLLVTWNASIDLTAARSADELMDLMLADALVLSQRLARNAGVVDIGTGAGAPGLALALVRPDLRVTLVEPLAKRRSFLRTVLGTVDRPDVQLEAQKGERLVGSGRLWDVALARATLPPLEWLGLGAGLVGPRGEVWVFLAKEAPPVHASMVQADVVEYALPLTGALRTLVRFVRRS
jgi:16S rRNA (guanine527-N7)-methyltransferase